MTIVMDEWMKAAMADDSLAAELLCKMKNSVDESQSTLRLPSPWPPLLQSTVPSWATRKPRTLPTVASRSAAVASATKRADKEAVVVDSTRCSPTTPLSWNGAASPSATADGGDESRSPTHNAARSKATATSDSASTKKCRRKRTFAELQEEESSLIKERIYLTKEIENINANYKAQRAKNESLKRLKLDLGSVPNSKPDSTLDELLPANSDQPELMVVPSGALNGATEDDPLPQAADSAAAMTESTLRAFLLPDLNMMPPEDFGSCTEVQCRTS